MAPKPKKTAAKRHETSTELAESIAVESLDAIRAEIRGIVAGKIVPGEHDPASRIAWLASKAATISGEQRKVEALNRRSVEALTPAQVLTWLRQTDQETRGRVLREAQQIDEGRSVLG